MEHIIPYLGGTPEVQNFINKYKASGYLIDPYSDEWIAVVEKRAENNEINYESGLDTYGAFDEEYGKSYRNHLLIVYVNIYNKELIEDLKKIYQPLRDIFDEQGSAFKAHKPDFLFINLATEQILCVGLGRKNKLMQFDSARYAAGQNESRIDILDKNAKTGFDSSYASEFTALDHDELIDKLVRDLKTLGDYLLENEGLNFYHDCGSAKPNDEGMYEFENGRDPVDQDGLDALRAASDLYTSYINESIESIKVFFPMAEVADLNPEDY